MFFFALGLVLVLMNKQRHELLMQLPSSAVIVCIWITATFVWFAQKVVYIKIKRRRISNGFEHEILKILRQLKKQKNVSIYSNGDVIFRDVWPHGKSFDWISWSEKVPRLIYFHYVCSFQSEIAGKKISNKYEWLILYIILSVLLYVYRNVHHSSFLLSKKCPDKASDGWNSRITISHFRPSISNSGQQSD